MALKSYFTKSAKRLKILEEVFSSTELNISYDKLQTENSVDHDVLYFNKNKEESELLFIFGFDFFVKELADQEFKKMINQNHLNFIILSAYNKIKREKKENEKIRISEILNQIQDKEKDSLELDIYIQKILSLGYYLNWEIKRDVNSIENDYFINIPNSFLIKIKQRFNLDIIKEVYENEDLFIFVNGKGKIMLVLKELNNFSKEDIINKILPVLKIIFKIDKINII